MRALESTPPAPDATELAARIAAGDAGAFEALFHTHADRLARFVYGYVEAWETAKDIVQEVFLRLWRGRADLAGHGDVTRLLYAVARNQARDHLRHRKIEDRLHRPGAAPMLLEEEMTLPPDGEAGVAANELVAAIQQAVDTLPPRQREILLLRWKRELSYEEIARELGIAPGTVAAHMQRAIARLRQILPALLGDSFHPYRRDVLLSPGQEQ
jgi:RNA polymerase sigma-70 factor (ECF subfamily)